MKRLILGFSLTLLLVSLSFGSPGLGNPGAGQEGFLVGEWYRQAQADAGADPYAEHCAACHGRMLEGASAPPLAGADFMRRWNNQSLHTLYLISTKAMPPANPGVLGEHEGMRVVAYILWHNGFAPGRTELSHEWHYLAPLILSGAHQHPELLAERQREREAATTQEAAPEDAPAEATAEAPPEAAEADAPPEEATTGDVVTITVEATEDSILRVQSEILDGEARSVALTLETATGEATMVQVGLEPTTTGADAAQSEGEANGNGDGASLYSQHCAACHGDDLQGNPPLQGESFLASYETVGDLLSYIQNNMPPDNPGGLDDETYRAITRFILEENGLEQGDELDEEQTLEG